MSYYFTGPYNGLLLLTSATHLSFLESLLLCFQHLTIINNIQCFHFNKQYTMFSFSFLLTNFHNKQIFIKWSRLTMKSEQNGCHFLPFDYRLLKCLVMVWRSVFEPLHVIVFNKFLKILAHWYVIWLRCWQSEFRPLSGQELILLRSKIQWGSEYRTSSISCHGF